MKQSGMRRKKNKNMETMQFEYRKKVYILAEISYMPMTFLLNKYTWTHTRNKIPELSLTE